MFTSVRTGRGGICRNGGINFKNKIVSCTLNYYPDIILVRVGGTGRLGLRDRERPRLRSRQRSVIVALSAITGRAGGGRRSPGRGMRGASATAIRASNTGPAPSPQRSLSSTQPPAVTAYGGSTAEFEE